MLSTWNVLELISHRAGLRSDLERFRERQSKPEMSSSKVS